jgi:hypothetical protein
MPLNDDDHRPSQSRHGAAAAPHPYQWTPFQLNNIHFSGEPDDGNLEWDRFHSFLKQATGVEDLSDEYKKFVLLKMLKGRAMQFYLDQVEFPTATYKHVETVMTNEFASKKRTTTAKLQEIVQKPKETVKEYYNRFMRAAKPATDDSDDENDTDAARRFKKETKLKLFGDFAVQFFVNGLRTDLRNAVFQARADTLEKVLEVAKAQEEYVENFGTTIGKANFSVSNVVDNDMSESLNNVKLTDTDATIRNARSILRNLADTDRRNDKSSSRNTYSDRSHRDRDRSRSHDRDYDNFRRQDYNNSLRRDYNTFPNRDSRDRSYSRDSSRSPSRERRVSFRDASPYHSSRSRNNPRDSHNNSRFYSENSRQRSNACFYCKKPGHFRNECRALQAANQRSFSGNRNDSQPRYNTPVPSVQQREFTDRRSPHSRDSSTERVNSRSRSPSAEAYFPKNG